MLNFLKVGEFHLLFEQLYSFLTNSVYFMSLRKAHNLSEIFVGIKGHHYACACAFPNINKIEINTVNSALKLDFPQYKNTHTQETHSYFYIHISTTIFIVRYVQKYAGESFFSIFN